MQIRSKKSNKAKISIAIILLLIGGVFAYLYVTRPMESNSNAGSSIDSAVEADKSLDTNSPAKTPTTKPDSSNSTTKTPTKVEDKTPVQYEGEKPGDSATTDNEQFRIPEEE